MDRTARKEEETKTAIEHICKIIASLTSSRLTPEAFRRASKNKPEVVERFWFCLFDVVMLCLDCVERGGAIVIREKASEERRERVKKDDGVAVKLIQQYMRSIGYCNVRFSHYKSFNTSETHSVDLLLALSYLLQVSDIVGLYKRAYLADGGYYSPSHDSSGIELAGEEKGYEALGNGAVRIRHALASLRTASNCHVQSMLVLSVNGKLQRSFKLYENLKDCYAKLTERLKSLPSCEGITHEGIYLLRDQGRIERKVKSNHELAALETHVCAMYQQVQVYFTWVAPFIELAETLSYFKTPSSETGSIVSVVNDVDENAKLVKLNETVESHLSSLSGTFNRLNLQWSTVREAWGEEKYSANKVKLMSMGQAIDPELPTCTSLLESIVKKEKEAAKKVTDSGEDVKDGISRLSINSPAVNPSQSGVHGGPMKGLGPMKPLSLGTAMDVKGQIQSLQKARENYRLQVMMISELVMKLGDHRLTVHGL